MGAVAPVEGFNAGARRALPRPRRAVHQRRGDDRLPGEPLGLLGHRRCRRGLDARPDDVRQGDGRRLPRCCVRRPRRRDGEPGARSGRSTRPARCPGTRSPRRPGSPRCGWRRRRSTTGSTWPPPRSRPWSTDALSAEGVPHVVQAAGNLFSCFFVSRRVADRRSATSTTPAGRPSTGTGRSSTRCSTRASTCRRARSRRGSSAPPTTTPRSTRSPPPCPTAARAAAQATPDEGPA